MSQKTTTNKILILVIIALLGVVGYLVKAGKTPLVGVPPSSDETSQGLSDIRVGLADPLDPEMLRRLQQEVDSGHQPWRLDPVKVARVEGGKYGFSVYDFFKLLSKKFGEDTGTYIADVEVNHKGVLYTIRLIQPGTTIGEGGIWIISAIGRGGR